MQALQTLIDGREFPSDSVLVRHEREVMASHMERSQGKKWRDALAAEFTAEWAKARAAT